jgi:uncharacterized glyoxalase superfamily protein PhnB
VSGWGVIPSIRVVDMPGALAFYEHVLGFDVERGGADESNCALKRGDARIMLETAADHYGDAYNRQIHERMGHRSPHALYIEAEDLDDLAERLAAAEARIVDPLGDRAWGQRELTVEDVEGNWLTFWRADGPS